MTICATKRAWKRRTGWSFERDGAYEFPGALSTITVRDGKVIYEEPNVWVSYENI